MTGHGGTGTGIARSRSIKNLQLVSSLSHDGSVSSFRTFTRAFGAMQPLGATTSLLLPALISGHGGTGTGIARSRSIRNLQPPLPSQSMGSDVARTLIFAFGSIQPSGATTIFPLPPLMSGHGGTGTGMRRSRSIRKRHGSLQFGSSVTVSVALVEPMQPSWPVVTVTRPENSGHGGGGGSRGTSGGGQSKMGGGGGAIEHSEMNTKSTLGIEPTGHLFGSNKNVMASLPGGLFAAFCG